MLNHIQIIGRLGKDPEVRYMPNGKAVANLTIATTEKWKDKQSGEVVEDTEWHRVSLFERLAEVAEKYLHKGSLCYISGKVKTRKWTDSNGVEKYSTEIRGDELKLLSPKDSLTNPTNTSEEYSRHKQSGAPNSPNALDDDIPF